MRGSLHCATHDETVSRFGRDDESADPYGMRTRGQAMAEATAKAYRRKEDKILKSIF
jgi:hypothetical protein